MNKKPFYWLTITFIFFYFSISISQDTDLYTPLNIQKAYETKTRSPEGIPGDNYWQNRSEYFIQAELFPATGMLAGKAKIKYFNESPDTLTRIVLRLYQDVMKKGNPRQFPVSPNDITDGIKLKSLKVNKSAVDIEGGTHLFRSSTNLSITLESPLYSSEKLIIEVEWEFKISRTSNIRMGQYSDTDFFIAYWYPQISVYDDIDGWDVTEYYGAVEFYNDFSEYEVEVTVPKDYLIWACGELQNGEKLYRNDIYNRYQETKKSDEVVRIITKDDYTSGPVYQGNKKNTWKFIAHNVSDFTFAASNHYLWDAVSLVVDTVSGRRALTGTIYPETAPNYNEVALFSRATIEYLSFELPGVAYPYPHVTTFCNGKGDGGMESPMMANNGAPQKRSSSVGLTFHEIAHNYFPFITGINERKYAWMDEGWATFLPRSVVNRFTPEQEYMDYVITNYLHFAGSEYDMPPMNQSAMVNYPALRMSSYYRPSMAFTFLQDVMGEQKFKEALQLFINTWQGKHPLPYDLFNIFDRVYGDNLNWFWNPWFFEFAFPDLAIGDVVLTEDIITLVIEKKGKLPVPVSLKVVLDDDSEEILYRSAEIWKENSRTVEIEMQHTKPIQYIVLGNSSIPDVFPDNNRLDIME
ncbi:MAG: M1 family metallopeptidase [Bacteroidales bacterium]|nr:M1 family metallopeptidase [Bacteroidales bacterium]